MDDFDINHNWYRLKNIDAIDSPALIIYHDRVLQNIRTLSSMIDDVTRLRPHAKTHKSIEATKLMMAAGINKFKCATVAEAEMLATAGAGDVLLAYQPTGPKIDRFITLVRKYPGTLFSCLIDNNQSANDISLAAVENSLTIKVFIDLNVGMSRTGIKPGEAFELYKHCIKLKGLELVGLHAYDGHIHTENYEERKTQCDQAFEAVSALQQTLIEEGYPEPIIIAGGSPTFPIHAKRDKIECSPGTFIFWDYGYNRSCKEQDFLPAALVISRVISLPTEDTLCLDLGHKSLAAENVISNRVHFLNAPDLNLISQSEEHAIVQTAPDHTFKIGDVFYGLPVHICPTVALYEKAFVVDDNAVTTEWKIIARDRTISI
jgi:D-serine deaminase-like pyridoxal phosphate-dependent protein